VSLGSDNKLIKIDSIFNLSHKGLKKYANLFSLIFSYIHDEDFILYFCFTFVLGFQNLFLEDRIKGGLKSM